MCMYMRVCVFVRAHVCVGVYVCVGLSGARVCVLVCMSVYAFVCVPEPGVGSCL